MDSRAGGRGGKTEEGKDGEEAFGGVGRGMGHLQLTLWCTTSPGRSERNQV